MSSRVREALRRSRRDLHREMAVPALYIAVPGAAPEDCTVREHDIPTANGRPGGKDQGYAQIADTKPQLIFLIDDAPAMIRPNAVISLAPGLAYRVSLVHPPHDITITADVVRLPLNETVGLPVPA